MLDVVTGPFHPDLEHALAEDIRRLKLSDPFAPLAIVVPSDSLRSRLKWFLCREQAFSLFNVHFLTFHQLSLRLYEEQQICMNAEGDLPPQIELAQDLFFEHLLGQIAHRKLPGLDALRLSSLMPGAWAALWTAIRDLKEAMVDPALALRGVDEGLFDPEEAHKLKALFTLYAAVLESRRALGVGSVDDLTSLVIPWVPHSRFLTRLRHVCYYGFYDLTQVQLSLFEAVVEAAPVTLYFPLSDDPAFLFARRFFERYLQSSRKEVSALCRSSSSSSTRVQNRRQVQIISAIGPGDELTFVCKEILVLVETHGYHVDEIGVVARALEPYQASLRRTFDQHRISFTSTAVMPVIQQPAAKVILLLARLPLTGFYWRTVLDVLTSPFYRLEQHGMADVEARPDLWQLAVRALGITRGEEEWRRLAAMGQVDAWVNTRQTSDEREAEWIGVDGKQVQSLWHLVSRLIRDCQALPVRGSAAELTDAFVTLASRHLTVPGLVADSREGDTPSNDLEALGSAVQGILEQLRQLDRIESTVTWEDWVRMFTQAIEQATIPIEPDNHSGVQVLDAMAARGLPFRALFLLGLNEKCFPRFIQEDAFLRDRHRRVLDTTLGYKIDEKLAGYEEEQLLFALLQQSAKDRLYLLSQRANAEGRPLAASAYLDAVQRGRSVSEREQDVRLPRRVADRMGLPQFTTSLLTREELMLWSVFQGHDPSPLLAAAGREADLFRYGWEALQLIENERHHCGPYDGVVGPLDRHWEQLTTRGVASTPLEQYARCPYQYFADHVLKLEPIRQPAVEELPAQVLGELCHQVLRSGYQRLVAAGWPQQELPSASFCEHVASAAEEVFTAYAARHGTGYALTWQLTQEMVLRVVTSALVADQQEYHESGFQPVGFEVEAEGRLEGLDNQEFESLKIRGRLDRVDQRKMPNGFRIIDYKYRQSGKMGSKDRDLITSAIRGFRLQPPLYTLMTTFNQNGREGDKAIEHIQPERVEFVFLAPHWDSKVNRSQFDRATWQTPAGQQLWHTLRVVLEGVRKGRYFILPDEYCDSCEFSSACRRFHGPTWWRAHDTASAKLLRQLRKQNVAHE